MSQLTPLKRQIRSIKTTKKLTHAMRLISMSLYSKLEKQQKPLEYHKNQLQQFFVKYFRRHTECENQIFFPKDILNVTPLIIIISSSKGFCGSLNGNLFRYLERSFFIEEHQTPTFITIGQKATTLVEEKKFGPIIQKHHDLNSNNFSIIADNITNIILNNSTYFSSATFYSTILKNFFTQTPKKNTIVPLQNITNPSISNNNIDNNSEEPIWEQNKYEIANFLTLRYLNTSIQHILFQALISEYSARFIGMDNATTNAESYLEKLALQFNKLRQGLITKEVSELSASL